MIFIEQPRYSTIKNGDLRACELRNLKNEIINSRYIATANNNTDFHGHHRHISLPTFIPKFKTWICNEDHIIMIN